MTSCPPPPTSPRLPPFLPPRLWHLIRLEDVNGQGFDETWRDDHFCYGHNPADVQPFHDLFLGQATGKGGDDQQRRTMRDERDAAKESGGEEQAAGAGTSEGNSGGGSIAPPKAYYTNQMLYELLKPDGMSIPYIYAHFEWPHCDVSVMYYCSAVLYRMSLPGISNHIPSWDPIIAFLSM